MPFVWERRPSEEFPQLVDAYGSSIQAAIFGIATARAAEIEAWMKQNASWQDQTGEARKQLFTDVLNLVGEAVVIVLSHGVEYGVFLELSFGGRYAVILPALDEFIPIIWQDVIALLGA